MSDIASTQARALEAQQVSRDKEVLSLRQQLLDFQSQSDEKTVIGQCRTSSLHPEFVYSVRLAIQLCNCRIKKNMERLNLILIDVYIM